MRLPKILLFRKSRKSNCFDGRNWTKRKQGFRTSESFAKLTKNFPENAYQKYLPKIIEVQNPCPKKYQNFWKFQKLRYKLVISVRISNIRHTQKMVKMVKNTKSCFSRPLSVLGRFWKRFGNVCIWPVFWIFDRGFGHFRNPVSGKFSGFRKGTPVHKEVRYRNVPEYTGKNVPVFPVHFPEIIPKSETVTGTHGVNRYVFM